jgi:hypothetical protein
MDLEKIKNYLQTYLDDVLTPTINKELVGEEDEPITLTVHALRKGSYQPPIFHIFIDIDPNWQGSLLKRLEKNIEDFIRIFSIRNRIKVHWNKRPLF